MKNNVWLFAVIILLVFVMGLSVGINIGTYALIDQVSYGLSGSTFIVQFNETKMVDLAMEQFNKTILPQIITPHDIEHGINYDATCPGLNSNKTVSQCIKDYEESQRLKQ